MLSKITKRLGNAMAFSNVGNLDRFHHMLEDQNMPESAPHEDLPTGDSASDCADRVQLRVIPGKLEA